MPLSVDSVARSFGGVHALDGVSFTVGEGEVHGLIGPQARAATGVRVNFNIVVGNKRLVPGGWIPVDQDLTTARPVPHLSADVEADVPAVPDVDDDPSRTAGT